METKLPWTLVALATLGGTAAADAKEDSSVGGEVLVMGSASHRGVAEDYLVLPSGGEFTSQMRFLVTAQPAMGDEPLRFSDLALFGLGGRWAFASRLEVSASVDLLPKQPSTTDEKPWQSAGLTLRTPLGPHAAVALTGAGGHLLNHSGSWTKESLVLQWRKPIARMVTFDVAGGFDAVGLRAPDSTSALLTEVAVSTSALFREPSGHWGAWLGIAYALPVTHGGTDPTTNLAIDPQPRLDLRVGNVVAVTKQWDLFVELAIVDRGDMAQPATRLPILDGGFDQRQIILGVTRHIEGKRPRGDDDGALELSRR
ncbi:MAG: hypothetical protein ABI867_12135 [Kofleriaceae bacterium]